MNTETSSTKDLIDYWSKLYMTRYGRFPRTSYSMDRAEAIRLIQEMTGV
jgi:hypothetical protein